MAKERRTVQTKLGNTNLLTEVSVLEEQWGMTRQAAIRFLRAARIPIIYVGNEGYFNFYTLEKVVFYLTRFGGIGFAAPGSVYKNKDKHKSKSLGLISIELTDEDAKKMSSPLFIAEFMASGPRNNRPQATSNLIRELDRGGI